MTPTRVLIVDDSAVVRGLLVRALQTCPDVEISGTAMHGEAALNQLQRQPADIVVLDIEMPVMDGLTALPRILRAFPQTRVIVASSSTYEGAETTVKALALGAAGCIAKPSKASVTDSIQHVAAELLPLVQALRLPKAASPEQKPREPAACVSAGRGRSRPDVVVIGTSTGGPNALSKLLAAIPAEFDLPILIVQHMPPLFTPLLAHHLAQDSRRPCQEAVDGGPIERGHIYLAPGDYHLTVNKRGNRMVTELNQNSPEHFCRPSVNPLFRSAAEWYGPRLLAVMLTGMGEDGLEGTQEVVSRKGYVIAQDEATSVVWGMPGALVRHGLAHEVLPLERIAGAICQLSLAR